MPELKSRKPKINFSFLFISTVIIFLLFLSTASFKAYAFNYIGTAGTPGMPDPSKDLVKIIAPNAVTDNIFIGQPITQLDWYGSGGRILLMNFDNSPETDIIVASPYGEYHFSNDYSGMILINKGPVTSNVPGASYGWDCGNWNNAPNTTSTGYILGHQTGEHSGYAVAGGSNIDGGRAIVIGRPYETGTLSQVAVLFSRDINTTNKTPSPIKSNLIDMSQTGDPTGTKGKTDMNNFGLLIKNIPGAYAAAGPATPPANFLPVNGMSLACGDVTGDGNEDIIIGCPHDNGNVGSVYVISGNGGGLWNDNDYTNAPVNIDISTSAPPAVYKISGINANDYFGASVLAADIYGGNDKELIIGAPGAQGKGGAVIIADAKAKIAGGANFTIADVALAAFAVASPNSSNGRRMGHAMAAGKFHDSAATKNDLVITEFVDDDSASNAYVVYGKVATPAAGAVVTVDVTIKPFKNNEKFGYAVACGDINGDGFHDIAVTAPRGYKIDTEAGEQRGRVCVLHGMPYATGTVIDLSDGTKPFYGSIFQTQGNYGRNHQSTSNNYFGFGVAIGDVGGPDARSELIVSSYSEVPSTETLFNNGGIYGATYVFYTSKCPTAPNTVQLASPGSGTNLTITWDNFSDPEGDQMTCYHAQLSTDPTFVDFSKIIDSTIVAVGGNTTQHNFGNVNDGTYFYRVRVGDSCSFSQFSAVKQVDIDSNPPTAVEDVDNINGQNFPAAGNRTIKVRVTDGVKCADWVTAEVWIKSLHDTNKNNVWDLGEGASIQANPTTPPAGKITQYSFVVNEGTENNSIKLYISGWDAAKNIIPAGIGGSRTTPKISYSVHSTVGPLVSNWLITPRDGFKKYPDDANGKFVNDLQPVITARLFDEDQPLSNIKLKIQGTDHTAFPPLEYIDPQLKFTPGGDLVEGTLPVELISAQDSYGNALQNITTKEYFVIDRTGPSVKEPSCQPANGGGTDQSQPKIVFALTEIANGVIGCGVADSIEVKVTNNGVTTTVTSLNGACFENGILNAAGAIFITPGAGGDYNITLDMTKTTRTLASGATTATLKAYDHLGNQLVGLTYTLNFTVSTVGPRAEKREPQPDNVKTKNGIVKIRLYSETFALDLSSTEIRINGPSPANNVLYYKLGTNENEFVYDPATEILTFDPSKRLGNPVVYEQGTITVFLLDAKDIKGNHLQSRPLTWSFIYDSIGPVAGSETEPAKNSWTKNNKQVVKMKISDATTKVVATSIKIKIDGVEYTTSSQGLSYDPATAWLTFDPGVQNVTFADKTIEIELTEAADEAGNTLTAGANNKWSFKVDSLPPLASNFNPPQGAVRNTTTVPVSCKLTDLFSGVDTNSIVFKINNLQISAYTIAPDGTLSYNANLPTGTNTCEISFKDIAGNFLTVNPNIWSFVIDNGRMQVISDATSPDPQHNSYSKNARNYFTLKMTKTTSGLDTDSITFNVLQGNPPESAQGTVTAEEKSDHYLIKWTLNGAEFAEGKIDVSLTKCHNLAGWNFLNAPYTWVFTYDKTNSFLTVDAQSPSPAPASIQTNSKVPISVKLDDALSGIDPNTITLSIASGGQAPPGADYTIQSNPDQLSYDSLNKILKFNTVNFFPDGKLTVTLKNAKDKAGNTYDTIPAGSLPYSWFFNIDTQNPVNQVTHPANDNEFILSNDDFITATLSEATGIDTTSIKLTLVSLPKTTIENAIAVAPPFLTFTGTNPRDGVLKYDPKQKTPPVQIPDSIVEVYITAKNNSGTNITPNPVKRTYKVDTKGPVIIDGSNPPVVDSRQPAPLSTVGVSATKPVSVKFRLEDLPGGVKKDSITYKFTTTDAAGNVLTDTATPLAFNDISANIVEAVYTLPNANITAGAIPDVCTCEIEILTATDQTAALHPLQAKATNKWHFYINNSNPTAINPYPPNGYVTTSSSEEVGITLFHAFGINTSSIEFYYNNTQALFPSSPASYIFAYDEPGAKLSFKPLGTPTSKWIEGTNTIELRHAKEKIGGKDITNPVIWSFLCDTVPPSASMNFPNTPFVTTADIDVLINLSDATSGIDPASVTFEIKKLGDPDYAKYFLTPGSALTYANNILKYSSGQPYQAGTYEVRLARAQDRAGHNYVTAPYPPGGPLPLTFSFGVVKDGPMASIVQPLPNAVVDYNLKPGSDEIIIKIEPPAGSPGVDPSSIELEITEGANPARLVKVIAGTGLTYDANTKLLSYKYSGVVPPLPVPEGKIRVNLKTANDFLGKPYVSSPNPLVWSYIIDTKAPLLIESSVNPMQNKYAMTDTQEITMRLDDGPAGSGFDTASIQLEVKYYPENNPGNQFTSLLNVGTFLKFENKPIAGVTGDYLLTFIPSPKYAEGTVDVRLVSCKDLAGHQYVSQPSGLSPYSYRFTVDLNAPKLFDDQVQPGHIAAVRYTKNNMLPVVMKFEDGKGSQVDPSSIQLSVKDQLYKIGESANLTYTADASSLTLTFTPSSPYPEGTIDVVLNACKDFAGRNALGSPSNVSPPGYRFTFVCDTVKPVGLNPVPMNGAFTADPSSFISLQLKDVTSGVNNHTLVLRDKNGNMLPLMPSATVYNPSTFVLRTRAQNPLPEGTVSVEVWCQDRATNEIESAENPPRFRWSFLVSTAGPTVVMTKPSPGTNPKFPRVNDNLQKLDFVFTDNGVAIEQASIQLTVQYPDSTSMTFKLTQPNYLTYDALNKKLTFNPGSNNASANPPIIYKEGTVSVSLIASNLSGFPLAGNTSWQFQVDSKGPYVIAGSTLPAPDSVTGNAQIPIKLKIKDDLGTIEPLEIAMRIENAALPGGFIDNITTTTLGPGGFPPLTFNATNGEIIFDPAKMGVTFAGEVTVILKRAKDDLGNGLIGGSYSWKFSINATSPWADNPTLNKVSGGIVGPTIPAAGALINSTHFITSMQLFPQQAAATINKNTIKVKIGGSEYSYSEPAMMYTPVAGQNYGILNIDTDKLSPAPSVPSNASIEIALTAVQNSLGTNIAAPYKYSFIIDTLAPSAGIETPADQSIIKDPRAIISVELLDPPSHRIDTSSIEFTVNGIMFNSTTGGLSYNPVLRKVNFNPASVKVPANYSYKKGNNNVSLVNARDEAGNPLVSPKSWTFFVDGSGPVALLSTATPAPDTITGDPRSVISIKVTSEGTKINPATFLVNIKTGLADFDISGTDEVRGVSYNETSGYYTIDPSRHPALQFSNGTVKVHLKQVSNLAGNQLQNPVQWEYYIDGRGPLVKNNSRNIGAPNGIGPITSNKTQKVFFDIADEDEISQIDLISLKMQVVYGGSTVEVGAYSPGCDYSVSLGRFTYDPSRLQPPVQYPDGTVAVILAQAKDKWGNNLKPGINNAFFFMVNTRGPHASDPLPEPGSVVKGPSPEISFKLTAEPPASIILTDEKPVELRVNGILYSSKQYPALIKLQAGRVVFKPAEIGLQFGSSQITFEIVSAFDSLGNVIRPSSDPKIGPSNSWIFKCDVTPPAISAPSPAHQSVTGSVAPVISATIRDNFVAVNKDTIRLKINGGAEIGQPFILYDSSTGRMSCNLAQAGLADRFTAGDNIIKITAVSDSLGNALTTPYSWNVYLDSQPPEVVAGSERPANGSKGNVLKPVISFAVADNPKTVYGNAYYGEVNRDSIKVRITNGSTDRTVKMGDTGFYYSRPNVTLDTALLGINLVDGLCEVSVLGSASGSANAMADSFGNKMAADYGFSFTVVSSGPYVYGVPTPAPNSAVTNNKPIIKINLRSDKSTIRPSTIKLTVDGVTYTTASQAMTYAAEEVRFNIADAGLALREGSIEVRLAEAEDELGNKLKADASGINPWTFRVDTAGPTAKVGANLISDELPTSALITVQPSETLVGVPTLKATYGDGSISYIDLSDPFGDQKYFSGVLELAAIPKSPVTFTFIGTDINGVNSETPITNFSLVKTSIMSPVTIKNQKYYLVGLPVAPDNTVIANVIKGLSQGGYTLWEGSDSRRQVAEYIKPGKGYWLLNSSGSDVNISASGYEMSVPMQKFDINLNAGWNLVSFPYNSRVKLNQCTVKSEQGEVSFFASENTSTERAMWSYDYDSASSPTFSLNHYDSHIMPFSGYYIYAYADCTLRVPPAFVPNDEVNKYPVPPYGMTLNGSGAATERNMWYQLSASCDGYRDDFNYLGLKDGAKDIMEPENDLMEPPANPIGQGAYLSAYLGEGTAVKYCSDFRSTAAVRKKWNFAVKTNLSGKTATISWKLIRDRLPYNYDLILYDRSGGGTINMRSVSSYQFNVTSTNERMFTVIFNPINASGEGGDPTDTTKPAITYRAPYENQQNVPVTSAIYARFSKKLNPASVQNSISVSNLSSGGLIRGVTYYDETLNEVSFKPENNLESNTSYKVTINNITDTSGNFMVKSEWLFTSAKTAPAEQSVNLTIKKGWNLIAVPLYPKAKTVSEIFAQITSRFVLYNRFGNHLSIYNGVGNDMPFVIGPGSGYWLYSHSDSDIALSIAGFAVPTDAGSETHFEIPLARGFNQLGVPFNLGDSETLSIAGFGFRLKNSVTPVNVTAAIGSGYIRNTLYTFTKLGISGQINPLSLTDVNAKLKKAEGFFIYSERDDVILRIPRPGVASPAPGGIKASKKAAARLEIDAQKSWSVKIGVKNANATFGDPNNRFGTDYIGQDGLDACDVIKLVSPEPYLTLYFVKDSPADKYALASDIRPPALLEKAYGIQPLRWRFETASKGLDYSQGSIFWDKKALPQGKLVLLDKALNKEIDMRAHGDYPITIDGATREYEIIYTPEMR